MRLPAKKMIVRVGPAGEKGREWTAPTHMEASIEMTSGRAPNKAEVSLYNLSNESISWLERSGHILQVLGGDDIAHQLFLGTISKRDVQTKVQGPDRITTITAGDGRTVYRDTRVNLSYPSGTTRATVLSAIITAMGLPRGHIASLTERTYGGGYAFLGKARDALDDVLDGEASWSIQQGCLYIVATGEALPGEAVLVSPDTGLIGSPQRTDKGADVLVVLNPALRPGVVYRVTSRQISGDYRAAKVRHALTSDGKSWETEVTGVSL